MNEAPTKQDAGLHLPSLPADVTPPRLLRAVTPTYPPAQQYGGIQGCAWIGYDISEEGKPINLRVLLSAPIRDFGAAALGTMSQWRFIPAVKDGHPIRIEHTAQLFLYRLSGTGIQPMPDCSFPGTHASRSEGIDTTSASGYGRRLIDLK
ncbi:MAG: energy transducer TonB [Gammaproteobacteria bacterium]